MTLPPIIEITLTRTRDGSWRATARGTGMPTVVLPRMVARALLWEVSSAVGYELALQRAEPSDEHGLVEVTLGPADCAKVAALLDAAEDDGGSNG